MALHQGDSRRAETLFAEGLALVRELGRQLALPGEHRAAGAHTRLLGAQHIAEFLVGLAGVAAVDGAPDRAARLFGAAEAPLRASGDRFDLVDQGEYDRNLAAVRAQVDAEAFAAAWAEGQAMTLEQAIAYGLGRAET
jgi:hypothetical protein